MSTTTINTPPSFVEMQESIIKAGGVFCQYRPCRRNVSTMYDIENIRHGVVYAQTPLNMNDPFDSMIGFSADKFFDDCIDQLMEVVNIGNPTQKALISLLLKNKALGRMGETIQVLTQIRDYLFTRQKVMHQIHMPILTFINQNLKVLYSKCPRDIKKHFSLDEFAFFAHIVSKMDRVPITAQNVSDMLNLDATLKQLYDKTIAIRDKTYLPKIQSFLSCLTVSCFSASGWNNQLMWAHYANSYSGICIEYDFSQIKDFIGFISPVKYSSSRPTLKLKDLGISISSADGKAVMDQNGADINAILSYLLYKNTCWAYEDEWRIINIGKEYTPLFVEMPYIKSITFGLEIDSICKQLLWDVCKEKGIPCYQLTASIDQYELERYLLTDADFAYDAEHEAEYIHILSEHFITASRRIANLTALLPIEDEKIKDFSSVPSILTDVLDMIADSHFMKFTLNRICEHSEAELRLTGVSENVTTSIKSIDEFVSKATQAVDQIKVSVPNLRLCGALNRKDYLTVKKLALNITEAAEKFTALPWNSYLTAKPVAMDSTAIPSE